MQYLHERKLYRRSTILKVKKAGISMQNDALDAVRRKTLQNRFALCKDDLFTGGMG